MWWSLPCLLWVAVVGGPDLGARTERGAVVRAVGHDDGRRLRADFAVPDVVVLVDSPAWPRATRALLRALHRHRAPALLLEPAASSSSLSLSSAAPYADPDDDAEIIDVPLDSGWVRDYGPLQVTAAAGARWIDASYAADRVDDDALPSRLAAALGAGRRVDRAVLSLEGGAVISNGAGLCASTTTSLAQAGLDLDDAAGLEGALALLGCRAWAVLPALSRQHEATGHVDMIAQFTSPTRVMLAGVDRGCDAGDARALDRAAAILAQAASALGQPLDVRRVPIPLGTDGRLLSYLNGVRVAGAFLVPRFACGGAHLRAAERRAYRAIAAALDGTALVPIPADELIALGGGVHCATLGLDL